MSASWELDLWGRVRYGTAAADAQYASAQADQRAARQAIVAALAKAWFLAGESTLQKRLITDVMSASETIVRLAEDRLRVGVGAEADVALARADLQGYRDTALQIDFALAQSRRALEVLLGRYPAAEIELPAGLIALPPPVATGVPSDLLERRPDIVAAERRFAAAFARVGRSARGAAAENLAERGGVIAHQQHLRAQDRLPAERRRRGRGLLPDLQRRPARGPGGAAHRRAEAGRSGLRPDWRSRPSTRSRAHSPARRRSPPAIRCCARA